MYQRELVTCVVASTTENRQQNKSLYYTIYIIQLEVPFPSTICSPFPNERIFLEVHQM